METYWANTQKPWGKLFYKIIWAQLPLLKQTEVLDFGSGFGISANHLAQQNQVTAIEPNTGMVDMRVHENKYRQIVGGLKELKQIESNSYDLVLCHNVLEYADERKLIFQELYRVAKPNATISIVKHNKAGRIMQKAVFENNAAQALELLNGGTLEVLNFGKVHYYEMKDIQSWIGENISPEKTFGCRTFFALQQNNKIKFDPVWQDQMFEIEMKAASQDDFRRIAFFNHLIFKKLKGEQ